MNKKWTLKLAGKKEQVSNTCIAIEVHHYLRLEIVANNLSGRQPPGKNHEQQTRLKGML